MNKVLIVTYYWPPSGGAGVQRWLKLSKYLDKLGVEVHVLTVDPEYASYMAEDLSLLDEISAKVQVHYTKSFEPLNWYAKLVGKEKVPTAGFSNVDTRSLSFKILSFIRSNLFIPDPRKGWVRFAVKKAIEIIDEFGIEHIITSSPPHSSQLIGLRLKKKRNIRWLADLRDPWTDIYYYNLLQHSGLSRKIDRGIEKAVIEKADDLITVNDNLKSLLASKTDEPSEDKFLVLPNGFDPEDFESLEKRKDEQFRIVYTGTMSDQYSPDIFLLALSDFIHNNEIKDIQLRIFGKVSDGIINKVKAMKLEPYFKIIDTVPHKEINQYQKDAELLLLLIPDVAYDKSITTGKIFEYMATGNPILCLGPEDGDAADIIFKCKAGATFNRDSFDQLKFFMIQNYMMWKDGKTVSSMVKEVSRYSRENHAKILRNYLFGQ